MIKQKYIDLLRVTPGKTIQLKDYDTGWAQTNGLKALGKDKIKEQANEILEKNLADLTQVQQLLYADDRYSLLIVFQAMDAAGKDGTIKHVMSGVNPQGCQVYSFKKPTAEELDHNFLWRFMKNLPERGRIGIFNRSYYEDVLVVKVHPELLTNLPDGKKDKTFWKNRYEDINAFERHLERNGTVILKFFLNVSKKTQKKRFMERLDRPEKNWKFSAADLAERAHWNDYMEVYEEAINATSTEWAPWYIIPADHKWATRALVADIITSTLRELDLKFPQVSEAQLQLLAQAREELGNE
ncbi:MAG: polyphosphate kinase 2 family protein [Methylococcales bacterium]|nr:polyphosphate kinase 2 family protein [Methylococcales bacterium]